MSTTTITQQQERHDLPEPGRYGLDVSHSAVEFVARHLMISKVRGRLADFDGVIHLAEVPEASSWARRCASSCRSRPSPSSRPPFCSRKCPLTGALARVERGVRRG